MPAGGARGAVGAGDALEFLGGLLRGGLLALRAGLLLGEVQGVLAFRGRRQGRRVGREPLQQLPAQGGRLAAEGIKGIGAGGPPREPAQQLFPQGLGCMGVPVGFRRLGRLLEGHRCQHPPPPALPLQQPAPPQVLVPPLPTGPAAAAKPIGVRRSLSGGEWFALVLLALAMVLSLILGFGVAALVSLLPLPWQRIAPRPA